jgi:heterodisulfide reductase subunit A
VAENRHDLVVLSQGTVPAWHPGAVLPIEEARDGFFEVPELATQPARSTVDGIFLAGVATGPKDIPDSIVEAGAAAMEAAMYLDRTRATQAVAR